jgi:hypothetical protein
MDILNACIFGVLFWGNLKLAMIMLVWLARKREHLEELEEPDLSSPSDETGGGR